MATTTPNYGWTVPTSTDLVKDGATAIETLGDAVDATVFANANAAIAKTIVDAKGDIIAATAADTVSRLAVGANNTVLTADSTASTGLKWSTPAGASESYSLINTGGTSMSGSSTVTVSGISGQNSLMFFIDNGDAPNNAQILLRLNADNTSKYYDAQNLFNRSATYDPSCFQSQTTLGSSIRLVSVGSVSGSNISAGGIIRGCNATGIKSITHNGGCDDNGTQFVIGTGYYSGTSTISSLSITTNVGTNFTGGTLYVYGSA